MFTDVSDQQRFQQVRDELSRQSGQQARIFQTALSHISDLIYVLDRSGRFVYANQPLLELWGMSLDQVMGKTFKDLGYPPEQALRLQAHVQQVIDLGVTVTDETSYVSPKGGEGHYEYIFNPIVSSKGVIEGLAGSTRVITNRKRLEQHAHFLSQFGQRLALLTDADKMLAEVTEQVGRYLAADRCYLCEWDPELDSATVTTEWSVEGSSSLVGTFALSDFGPKEWWTLLTAGNVAIADFDRHFLARDFLPSYQALGIRSYATARFKREFSGVVTLVVTMKTPRNWRADELGLLENVIARVWPLVERAREDRHAAFLSRLSQKISVLADPEEITRTAIQGVGEHLGVHRCYFFETVGESDRMRVVENWHRPEVKSITGEYALLEFGSEEWWRAVRSRRVMVHDLQKEGGVWAERFAELSIRSYATVPFVREGRWVAGLAATSNLPRTWHEGELKLLEDVIARVWPVVERARVTADLQQSAERLNLALSAAELGDFIWDAKNDEIVLSPRAAEIFGAPQGAKLTRTYLRNLLHPDDQERARAANQRAMETRTD